MPEVSEDEEEIEWAREALASGDLTVEEILQETGKPIEYWRRKLGNSRLRAIKVGRPKSDPQFPTVKPQQVWDHILKDKMSVTEIAKHYGVSKSRISQLKNRGY